MTVVHAITRAVIPAAGLGTRMLPAAKAVPKELLPVLDKPVLQYVVEEAAAAGADDVLLVTSPLKPSVLAHFRRNPDLEKRLKNSGKDSLLAGLNDLMDRVKISSVDQMEQRGLGDAVLQARRHVGDHPFLCLLGDTIFTGGNESPARQLAEAYARLGTSIIGLEEVPPERVSRYGIVGGNIAGDGVMRIETLVEKPSPDAAPSRLAIAARYVLTPRIFPCLNETKPGKGGEIQLTDALRLLLAHEPIHGVVLRATRHDVGNPRDWLKTNLILAARDEQLWRELSPLVRTLLGE
jgi:UTP--glucose-1-phosphate uridylyltransferase